MSRKEPSTSTYKDKAELPLHAITLQKQRDLSQLEPVTDASIPARDRPKSFIRLRIAMSLDRPPINRFTSGDHEIEQVLADVDSSALQQVNELQVELAAHLIDEASGRILGRDVLEMRAQVLVDLLFAAVNGSRMIRSDTPPGDYGLVLADALVEGLVSGADPSRARRRSEHRCQRCRIQALAPVLSPTRRQPTEPICTPLSRSGRKSTDQESVEPAHGSVTRTRCVNGTPWWGVDPLRSEASRIRRPASGSPSARDRESDDVSRSGCERSARGSSGGDRLRLREDGGGRGNRSARLPTKSTRPGCSTGRHSSPPGAPTTLAVPFGAAVIDGQYRLGEAAGRIPFLGRHSV